MLSQVKNSDGVLLDYQKKAMYNIDFSAPTGTNVARKDEDKQITMWTSLLNSSPDWDDCGCCYRIPWWNETIRMEISSSMSAGSVHLGWKNVETNYYWLTLYIQNKWQVNLITHYFFIVTMKLKKITSWVPYYYLSCYFYVILPLFYFVVIVFLNLFHLFYSHIGKVQNPIDDYCTQNYCLTISIKDCCFPDTVLIPGFIYQHR